MNLLPLIIGLAGGLGLFIYGMQLCSESLQKLAARRLKQIVKVLTNNPLLGILLGSLIAMGLQSSSAASALVVGFVGAGLMTLAQALGVLLGSAVGASLTAQVIAFKVNQFALILVCGGSFFYIFSRHSQRRIYGQIILGLGLLFYGINVISTAMAPIRDFPFIIQILGNLEQYPILEFLAAMILTAALQSSPAFLALLMSLSDHGLVSVTAIIPYVLGAHLGGTITGVLSSLGAPGLDSKRAAISNFIFKSVNGLVFLPLAPCLTSLILKEGSDISRGIANAHTFFSLAMVIAFWPFTKPMANFIQRLIPGRRNELNEAVFLDESLLEIPELAVEQAHRQTVAMGRMVEEKMLSRTMQLLNYRNEDLIEQIQQVEKTLDQLYQKISRYLTGLGNNSISSELMQRSICILYVANDLEHIGDIMLNIAIQSRKIKTEAVEFSEEGLEELMNLSEMVNEAFRQALTAFETGDETPATRVIKEHPRVLRYEKELRYNHFGRMQGGNPKTMATSSIHLDLVEAMFRIENHAVTIAQVVLGIV
ncbi:MAG: Na/Pi cotransporter family protein [Firmicutes bacterium]|nr:Na/Pi cotransporter family protein [Bacillota bacterium]